MLLYIYLFTEDERTENMNLDWIKRLLASFVGCSIPFARVSPSYHLHSHSKALENSVSLVLPIQLPTFYSSFLISLLEKKKIKFGNVETNFGLELKPPLPSYINMLLMILIMLSSDIRE